MILRISTTKWALWVSVRTHTFIKLLEHRVEGDSTQRANKRGCEPRIPSGRAAGSPRTTMTSIRRQRRISLRWVTGRRRAHQYEKQIFCVGRIAKEDPRQGSPSGGTFGVPAPPHDVLPSPPCGAATPPSLTWPGCAADP